MRGKTPQSGNQGPGERKPDNEFDCWPSRRTRSEKKKTQGEGGKTRLAKAHDKTMVANSRERPPQGQKKTFLGTTPSPGHAAQDAGREKTSGREKTPTGPGSLYWDLRAPSLVGVAPNPSARGGRTCFPEIDGGDRDKNEGRIRE